MPLGIYKRSKQQLQFIQKLTRRKKPRIQKENTVKKMS